MFYNNIQSCVINNGLSSDNFRLERGVRHGDPVSPYLFVLAAKVLAVSIRQNSNIKGISIDKEEAKLLQYADNTTAVLADENSASAFLSLLESFKHISGLKINCTQTEAMWIGSSRNNNSKPFGLKWPSEPIKALGVFYTYNQRMLLEKNFIERLDSIKNPIRIWSSRGLSIYGKVTLIKSVLIRKFVYISSLLLTPKEFVKELNQILFHFLWKGPDKVTRVSVINEYDKGGLKMTDVDSMVMSLRLAWLKRLLIFGSNDGFWKRYLLHLLEPYGGFFFFKCNFDIRDYPNLPQIYSELLQWWSEFREMPASEKDRVHIIWNNKDIRIDKKPICYKKLL